MRVVKEMILREIVGENILVPTGNTVLENNGLFMLTDTAAFIWKILPEARDEQELVERLLKEYEVDEKQARQDIDSFLTRLRNFGIID